MLTGGFYAEVDLSYDPSIAEEKSGRPFGIDSLREIQLSKRDALDTMARGRMLFTFEEWRDFLLRSIGLEPESLTPRTRGVMLLRMVPFVENNYNAVELGPRGTGKSHLFQQVSPYAHLVSGGKASVARMFVNNSTGQRGLVCQYDVVCFDEVSGISFDQKDGVNIMKGYMESGEFSRGKESIRGFGSIYMVGNFDVDVAHQQRIGHLFGPMPPEMRDDTAFMDRIHAYLPGWDIPKVSRDQLTDHFGLVSDFLSSCWNHLRGRRGQVLHCNKPTNRDFPGRGQGSYPPTRRNAASATPRGAQGSESVKERKRPRWALPRRRSRERRARSSSSHRIREAIQPVSSMSSQWASMP
jgi:ATP-dependent Lon protease